ncbi:MAG: YicC family protein [Sulfuriferula sp.]|nr:YicC family protein [Sulfuriferula sp.]
MIYSMTGYAAVTGEYDGQVLSFDLRAVNSRYLELHFRAGDEFRGVELALRERISQLVVRGKLECRIALSAAGALGDDAQLNTAMLDRLTQLAQQVEQRMERAAPLNVADVLNWPGMLLTRRAQQDWQGPCMTLLEQALLEFQASRQREGEKLAEHIVERLDKMQWQVDQLKPHLPTLIAAYQQKLIQRFAELIGNAEDERIPQEVGLFAQKMDVDEEISRLQVHILAVRNILKKGGAVGKRLDFMMQELNREANTLGSKSVSVETTQTAMELKVLIEQMREQVQNLE